MKFKNKFSKKFLLISVIVLANIITFATPTLSRFVNEGFLPSNLPVWDGSIATSYNSGDGTKESPYVISSGAELAYFSEELKTNDYKDTYFILGNDIILNNGFFIYEEETVKYVLNDEKYYIKEYTNELYSDKEYLNKVDLEVNIFNNIENFAGNLNGSFNSIYGLYISEDSDTALIENLSGTVNNIFIENTMIVGNNNVAGLSLNSNDANISDTFINGYVISKGNVTNNAETKSIDDVNFTTSISEKTFTMFNNSDENLKIISSKLTGDYVVDIKDNLNYELKLNDTVIPLGNFEIDLQTTPLNEVVISTTSDESERNVSLINLEYEVVYEISNSSALINNASNTNITNVVTDVDVYNNINSSGFISNANNNINITNSYNTGSINGTQNSSAFIGTLDNTITSINNSYNSGLISNNANVIGVINKNSEVTINNTFNNQNINFINKNNSSNTINNNIYNTILDTDNNINEFDSELNSDFYNNLQFLEYETNDDTLSDVWIIEDNKLPELYYMDEINLIDVRISNNSWNDYHIPSDIKYYNKDITVAVTSSSYVYTIDKVEYYIKNDNVSLTLEELETLAWNEYENAINLSEEGSYIIYVKITDYAGKVRYINTDTIIIDKTAPVVSMNFKEENWNTFRKDVNEIFVEENSAFIVNATDEASGIKENSYYVTDEIITEEDLSKLNDANWTSYNDEFNILPVGNNVVYTRSIDYSGNISYLNSDIITFDGYHMNYLEAGKNSMYTSGDEVNISSNSSVKANFIYNVPSTELTEYNHHITFNKMLPQGTVIILTDNITGQKYDYKIMDQISETNIPFTSFNTIGSVDGYYSEHNYDNGTNIVENFTITLDFEDAIIISNIFSIKMELELQDNSGVVIRDTANSSIIEFNIFTNTDAVMYISTNPSDIAIKYNVDSITTVDLNAKVNYYSYSSNKIIDTFIEEQNLVMKFQIYDNYDQPVDRNKLNNIVLKIDGNEYFPDNNGIFTISLETGILEINKNLEIHAYKGDNFLDEGIYSIKASNYASYSGYTSNYITTISIPLLVTENVDSSNVKFAAEMLNDQVLKKENINQIINLETSLSGVDNPNIRISLYKKDEYNATNQNYTLIDLNTVTTENLTSSSEEFKYIITSGVYDFELNLDKLDKQSYKIVIESYDGDNLISKIDKQLLIK